ncbi:glycoside hydrolase family 2 TIM barrel-domain containing protein [Leifsonia sp. 2MCAF36]|uniref:glycoside hydrolase family 2 TIM barrel-domain containing protein n=1 Tax=Leifsonia sp. 2MCAF36 TaxID=3232988 RepID=UPI003F955469
MLRYPFNDHWQFGPLISVHEAINVAGPGDATITLPHDAMLAGGRSADHSGGPQTAYFKDGKWSYEKWFDVPSEWANKRVTLEFEGVYRDAAVYINGALAGQWANGYSTFYVAADAFLLYGTRNAIRVDSQAHQDSRWYSGGGIYRPVNILIGDLVHVTPTGLRVSTPDVDDDLASVVIQTEIANEDIGTRIADVDVEVRDASGAIAATERTRITLRPGDVTVARQRVFLHRPNLWSVDTPTLYEAQVRVQVPGESTDEASTTFGVRTVTVDPVRGLRINGASVKLRGGAIHHDNGILGAAEFQAAADRRVRLLKEAGFNAIRSAHNPISRELLDACDRFGVLVMDEVFDMWTVPKSGDDYSKRFSLWWERDIDAVVAKDFNHPSVILYSVGNEIIEAGTSHGGRYGRLLADRLRQQDPTRLITHALQGMYIGRDKIPELRAQSQKSAEIQGINDYLGQVTEMIKILVTSNTVSERLLEPASALDVMGLNYGDDRFMLDKEQHPNRVVLSTESFPTKIDEIWRLVIENAHVIGDFTWTAWDFLGEVGTGRHVYPEDEIVHRAPYPWLTAEEGDLDIVGRRNPLSYYREAVFGLTDTPYIGVRKYRQDGFFIEPRAWTWSDVAANWTVDAPPGTPLHVEVYSTGDSIEYRLNGAAVASAEVGTDRPCLAAAEIPYETGVLEVVAFRDGKEIGRSQIQTAGRPASIALNVDRRGAPASDQEIFFVDITLRDDAGVLVETDDRVVTVELEGPGLLQGFGAATPATDETYLGNAATTYKGHALAAVRSTGEAGTVRLITSTPGLPTASATVELS